MIGAQHGVLYSAACGCIASFLSALRAVLDKESPSVAPARHEFFVYVNGRYTHHVTVRFISL